jgi:hypothetical protein
MWIDPKVRENLSESRISTVDCRYPKYPNVDMVIIITMIRAFTNQILGFSKYGNMFICLSWWIVTGGQIIVINRNIYN